MRNSDSLIEKVLERTIFASRWLQAPLYIGLILAQCIYVYQFFVELWHLLGVAFHWVELDVGEGKPDMSTTIMLSVLALIDVVMIANLLIMVIIGGYETFVSRLNLQDQDDAPEWLSHVNAGALKVKLATALISISSIHLLKTFIEVRLTSTSYKNEDIMWQVIIHVVFVISAIALAWADKLMMANAKVEESGKPH